MILKLFFIAVVLPITWYILVRAYRINRQYFREMA